MKIYGKLTGFDEFDKKLNDMAPRIANRVLQGAVTRSLRSVLPEMKALAPRDEVGQSAASKLYGRLRSNIKVARLRRVRKGQKGSRIYTGDSFWGVFYELGTRNQRKRPFFAPGIKRLSEKIFKVLGVELGKGIEKELGRK